VRLRIGIASGPVVAGVIGRRRFSYDLWGDTVNTASRMQTSGAPGCIQVTERTRDLLGDRYLFQGRGMIQVKGKGKMLTYFLSGRARKHDQMLDLTEPH
jgi:adenylate cyclase